MNRDSLMNECSFIIDDLMNIYSFRIE